MATVFIQKRERENRNSYVITFKDPLTGKNVYFKTLRKKSDAQQTANDLRAMLDSGKIPKKKHKFQAITFFEAGQLLEAEWNRKLIEGEITNVTYADYTLRIKKLNETFGKRLIIELVNDDILKYRTELAEKISNATANRYLFIIKQIYKICLGKGFVQEDITDSMKYLSEKAHERDRYLYPDELNKLIDACLKTKAQYYLHAIIYLGAEHGTSKQECLSLKWSDIDFDYNGTGIIRFHRTKNGINRTHRLMPRTRQALSEWRSHLEWMRNRKRIVPKQDVYVFCQLNGQPKKSFKRAFNEACSLAGIEDFHYHDLRHTYCSNLKLIGADSKDIKDMIGHLDIGMTDRYTHLSPIREQNLQDQLAIHYGLK